MAACSLTQAPRRRRKSLPNLTKDGGSESAPHNPAERMMSCVRRSTKVLSARLFLLEEGLGYGLVVPFPAYGFAALVSHNENLNSPKQQGVA